MWNFESSDASEVCEQLTTWNVFQDEVQVAFILAETLHSDLWIVVSYEWK